MVHTPVGKLTDHQEMYIKAVHVLCEQHKVARVKDIADYLGVTKSSVSSALKHLSEKGLIDYEAYSFATLSPKGEALATELLNKYDVLSDFLTEILDVPSDIAQENACRLEHVVDDFVMERLVQFLKFLRKRDISLPEDMVASTRQAAASQRKPARRKRAATRGKSDRASS